MPWHCRLHRSVVGLFCLCLWLKEQHHLFGWRRQPYHRSAFPAAAMSSPSPYQSARLSSSPVCRQRPRSADYHLGRSYNSLSTSASSPYTPQTSKPKVSFAWTPRELRLSEPAEGPSLQQQLDRLRWSAVVNLSFTEIGDGGAVQVAHFLIGNSSVEELRLSSCGLTSLGVLDISYLLPRAMHLKSLDLSHNHLGSGAGFAEFMSVLKRNVNVTSLDMSHCRLSPDTAHHIADMLRYNPKLVNLNLGYNYFGRYGGTVLLDGIRANGHLLDCQVNVCEVESGVLLTISEILLQNARLKARQSYPVKRSYDQDFIRSIVGRSFQDCRVEKDQSLSFEVLASQHQYERFVDLSHRNLGDEGLFEVAHMLSKNRFILEVDLSGNGITGKGLAYLGDALTVNTTLTKLILNHNPLGRHLGFLEFCRSMSQNFSVTTISLRSCDLTAFHLHSFKQLLVFNRYLENVDLSFNDLGIIGGELLLEAVKRNLKVKDCQLTGCGVDRDAMLEVARHLQANVAFAS